MDTEVIEIAVEAEEDVASDDEEVSEEDFMMDHLINTDYKKFAKFAQNDKYKTMMSITVDPSKESTVWLHLGKLLFKGRSVYINKVFCKHCLAEKFVLKR
jgi:hypothetical protein